MCADRPFFIVAVHGEEGRRAETANITLVSRLSFFPPRKRRKTAGPFDDREDQLYAGAGLTHGWQQGQTLTGRFSRPEKRTRISTALARRPG